MSSASRLRRDDSGVVYAEFIISFVPFFLLFLAVIQLAILAATGIVVQHAAGAAVRAAMVVIDDDPYYYGDDVEPRGRLSFVGEASDDTWVTDVADILATDARAVWTVREGSCNPTCKRVDQIGDLKSKGGPRLRAIRRAAYLPLSLLSPEWNTLTTWFPFLRGNGAGLADSYNLRDTGIGTTPATRLVTGFLGYNPIASAINFPTEPHSETLLNVGPGAEDEVDFSKRDTITVRVTHLTPCGVPLVNALICRSLLSMAGLEQAEDLIDGLNPANVDIDDLANLRSNLQERWEAAERELDENRRKLDELQGAEYSTYQYALYLLPKSYFHIVSREATLPIQKATYRYVSEMNDE